MDYLSRQSAPFDDDLWQQIDEAVVQTAKETLVGRRFLPFFGPVGPGLSETAICSPQKEEILKDGFSVMKGRQLAQVPQLYEDFPLYWRDLEDSRRAGFPVDLSAARVAARTLARREDQMIFYGAKTLGLNGLLTVQGSDTLEMGDWNTGENAFLAVAKGVSALNKKGCFGKHSLVVSSDLLVALHRLQPGTGIVEMERVKSLVGGRLYACNALEANTAVLLCAQPQYIDLMVGLDISTAYLELVDLNHRLRVLETAILRVKSPEAIVVYK